MKKIFRFIFYPYQKKKLLIKSLFLIGMIRISLWIFPFRWLNRWLSYFDPDALDNKKADWEIINDVVSSVRAASKYVPFSSCLTQALAARTLLNRREQDSVLKIGVDREKKEIFEAHAWIEIEGRIIIGKLPRHQQRFVILNPSDSVVI